MQSIDKTSSIQHLAGIVPIGGQKLDFNMPWEDSLMPIAQNYLAVERAVFQCALAGCETIWVVGHLGTQPLIRKRVGDILIDPISLNTKFQEQQYKEISIYYVPIHPRDRTRRDGLGWSVLHGADNAFRVSRFISKWIAPERFFCSFPYGIVPDESLRENRLTLSSKQKVLYSYDNKTVKNSLHLPFTFDAEDYFRCRDIVKRKQAEEWGETSARFYDLKTVFKGVDSENASVIELPWFHDISSWEGYKNYLSSPESQFYSRPNNLFKGNKRKPFERKRYEQDNREDLQSNERAVQE